MTFRNLFIEHERDPEQVAARPLILANSIDKRRHRP